MLLADIEGAYERYWTPDVTRAIDAFVDDLSNWYIRRSRHRFWSSDAAAISTLWWALVQVRAAAPVMPFLSDHLWRNLVAGAAEGAPDLRVPRRLARRRRRRRAARHRGRGHAQGRAGHQARGDAGIKLRQPLRRVYVRGADGAYATPQRSARS